MSLQADVQVRLGSLALDVEIAVAEGEVVVLLGPNGAGKTTLLKAVAGLVAVDQGTITLDSQVLDDPRRGIYVPTERRPIGFVFQDYLLFPHLSVVENVAFGLRCRGLKRRHAGDQALDWLGAVGLADHARARPSALSGGQRQRVALARALAFGPRLLLLDEPLAALDASTRADLRRDLKQHLASFGGIRLIVTHDPLEAVTLADRLVVIENGSVVQVGSPAEVTARPRSRYVADLVGVNLFRGHAEGGSVRLAGGRTIAAPAAERGEVFVVIRPRVVAVHRSRPEGSPRNVWQGRAEGVELLGDRVRLRVGGEMPLVAEVTAAAVAELRLAEGGEVWLSFKATEVEVYPA